MLAFATAYRSLDEARHRVELYRTWRVGVAAGFTTVRSLEAMGPRQSAASEAVRQWFLDGSRRRTGLAALAQDPRAPLDDFERALLVLGDETGAVEDALRLLGDLYGSRHRLMLWIKKQLVYPLMIGLVATAVLPLELLIDGRGGAALATAIAGLLLWAFVGGSVVLAAERRAGRTPRLVRARLARALAIGIEAGLPLGRAVHLAADATADADIRAFVARFPDRTLGSQTLVTTLTACPHMTPDFLAALNTAEQTGDFAHTMTRLAELYEDGFR